MEGGCSVIHVRPSTPECTLISTQPCVSKHMAGQAGLDSGGLEFL